MSIRQRRRDDNAQLLDVWERSVRATHHFLGEADIASLRPHVRDVYLDAVEVWVYEDAQGLAGFIGLAGAQVEMLFLEPARRGQGIGTRLLDHARGLRGGALTVDVNEDNPQAHGFYRRYGFVDTGRSPLDGQGRPFALIHMALSRAPAAER